MSEERGARPQAWLWVRLVLHQQAAAAFWNKLYQYLRGVLRKPEEGGEGSEPRLLLSQASQEQEGGVSHAVQVTLWTSTLYDPLLLKVDFIFI